ncbi:MAG: hypothetical protein M1822_005869 [Bathelium mastoideum]|nr:MAG: hypothetical protein M1822_005869 [Bathelium mastoideum]
MASPMPPSMLYLNSSDAALKRHFRGRHLRDINPPAAIIDAAVVRRNCASMLQTVKHLGVGFRAHVKTHKTTQITRLQVGDDAERVNLIVSTVTEAEQLLPYLLECKARGKAVNVLYGVPPPPSAFLRLGALARRLGSESVSLLLDHPDVLECLSQIPSREWPRPIFAFVKVDTGYHRAGATPESTRMRDLVEKLVANKEQYSLQGFYSHMGHSYGFSSSDEALEGLAAELEGAAKAAEVATGAGTTTDKLIITVGATPTATGAQNIMAGATTPQAKKAREAIERVKEHFKVELHAGVYPVLDLQQLATRARPPARAEQPSTHLSTEALGLRILVQVASVYNDRGKPEALIAAGTLALGREPCKSYPGWAIVTPWQSETSKPAPGPTYSEDDRRGWIVGRISQEHGILTWEGAEQDKRTLEIGDKLMLWPNHACVAGSGFGRYLVVDSEKEGDDANIVQDVWVRWRGW